MENANYRSNPTGNPSMNIGHQPCRTYQNHASTETHAATLQDSSMSNTFATSNESLATSLTSTGTMPSTAATSSTSLDAPSNVPSATSDTSRAVSPEQSETSSDQLPMPCVCCWGEYVTLLKHYPYCPCLNGDWKFWASPFFCTLIFYNREAFTNHISSLNVKKLADNLHIESTPRRYVTPRNWTTLLRKDAMKRQLKNILDEYFKDSDFAAKWKALNNDDMSPNLNNITDMHDVLKQCSEILCRHRAGGVQESPIDQLKELFRIDTEDVAEITTQDVPLSKKRKCSVPYNAFDGIKSIDQPSVEVADTGFTGEQFTRHQRDQIGEQDQPRHASMGGVMQAGSQWSGSGSSDAEFTGDTSNAPSALGHQTQSTNWVPDETPNDLAGLQSGASPDFADGTGFPQQTLQQGQDAHADPNADPNANPNADVEINALHACFNEWYYSVYLSQNPMALPQAPYARQNINSNASNDFGTSDSRNTNFPPPMQYQQTMP